MEKSDKDNNCDKAVLVFHSTTHQAVAFFSHRKEKFFKRVNIKKIHIRGHMKNKKKSRKLLWKYFFLSKIVLNKGFEKKERRDLTEKLKKQVFKIKRIISENRENNSARGRQN